MISMRTNCSRSAGAGAIDSPRRPHHEMQLSLLPLPVQERVPGVRTYACITLGMMWRHRLADVAEPADLTVQTATSFLLAARGIPRFQRVQRTTSLTDI
jgi:hypothetical protein